MNHLRSPAYPAMIAGAAAIARFAVGMAWGTFAAGGSDSSCYLNQARLFRTGTTHFDQPLIGLSPWPRADWTFTPAGHIPSAVSRNFIVPICPPGLPLLMAGVGLIPRGEFLVVPLCGALAVTPLASRIRQLIADIGGYTVEQIDPNALLVADLGYDSLLQLRLIDSVRTEYPELQEAPVSELLSAIENVDDVVRYVAEIGRASCRERVL